MSRILSACAVLLLPVAASADIQWQLAKKQGQAYLQGASGEPETDKQFWAHCRADGGIDIGVGAEFNVGDGKGEPVALMLVSGGATAKLAGQSRKSADFQMTAGTELRASIKRDDALFAVLGADKPIAVSGSMKPTIWQVKGLKAKAAAFLNDCK